MIRKERKKGAVWKHFFKTVVESNNSHPFVQCKYCCKNYQRAVPERMQAHLDKCSKAPSNAKSQPKQQQLINNFNGGHMSEDQNANILSSQHFTQRPQSSFELQDSEEMNMQIEYSDQSEPP
ncbi:10059_t:CDS:1, partial [Rhizophagus irregularis]